MNKLFRLGLASLLTVSTLYAGTYTIDKVHSNVGFKIKHLMITNVTGNFDKFSGTIEFDEKTNTVTSLTGNIKTASVNTDNVKRDKHLRAPEFFNAEKYPNMTFKLDSIKNDKAYGVLTIRGVSKNIVLDFELTGTVKDPWGKKKLGLELEGEMNRKDYGLNWNRALEAGGVVLSNKVKLLIEIEAELNK